MSSAFDKIITSTPANATAGRVMSRGEHWEPEGQIPPGLKHWKAPPLMREYRQTLSSVDMTGKKFGRFTVLGMWAGETSDGARWVCRCVCGDYEVRSVKTIKSAMAGISEKASLAEQCYYCHAWSVVQKRYKTKGSKPISDFINPTKRAARHQSPEAIIAAQIGDYDAAVKIVAELMRSGFRIVREVIPGAVE